MNKFKKLIKSISNIKYDKVNIIEIFAYYTIIIKN